MKKVLCIIIISIFACVSIVISIITIEKINNGTEITENGNYCRYLTQNLTRVEYNRFLDIRKQTVEMRPNFLFSKNKMVAYDNNFDGIVDFIIVERHYDSVDKKGVCVVKKEVIDCKNSFNYLCEGTQTLLDEFIRQYITSIMDVSKKS